VTGLVQRRNLNQDGLDTALGVADKNADRQLVGDPRTVHVYKLAAVATKAQKLEALAHAGEVNAGIGNAVRTRYEALYHALRDKERKAYSPSKAWTHPTNRLDDPQLIQIDPFFAEVPVKYGTKDLTLTFQHAEVKMGYVATVLDTGNPKTGAGVNLIGDAHAQPEAPPSTTASSSNAIPGPGLPNVVGPGEPRYTKYGSAHDEGGTENILEATEGGSDKSFDAYTKLAGEGARWQSVRKHGAYLKDTSRFFVRDDKDPNKVLCVAFSKLWKAWMGKFDKKYDVPDRDLAAYLRKGHQGYVEEQELKDMNLDDYDVDAGKPYREVLAAASQTATNVT
jgi:hypothetical protein